MLSIDKLLRVARREEAAPRERRAPAAPGADAPLSDLDTQLMLAVRDGNSDAANTLIRRNFERIARFIGRVVRDAKSVEDLTQDVFLNVLSHAREFEPRARFATWLYRIATNRTLNYLKQMQVRRPANMPVDDPPEVADRPEAAPDRDLGLDELRRRVAAAVAALPPNQRVALTLFEYEGLRYEQIAAALDVSVDAVRCLLSRARARLREDLAELL